MGIPVINKNVEHAYRIVLQDKADRMVFQLGEEAKEVVLSIWQLKMIINYLII